MDFPADSPRPDIRASRRARVLSDACSAQWDRGGIPAWGTAARADFWLAVEQPGPWGHDAFASSHLGPDLGKNIEAVVASAGGRALLIRRPGRAGDARVRRPRQIFLACGAGIGRPTLLAGRLQDPADVLDLPWDVLGSGGVPDETSLPGLTRSPESVALICTNAKRDVCCALRGLPLAANLAGRYPDRVWECSHTGGHRFAPTGVLLPTGATLGRLDAALADAAMGSPSHDIATALLDRRVLRGLAHLAPLDQTVDAYARIRWDLADIREPVRIEWEPGAEGGATQGRARRARVTGPARHSLRVEVTARTDPEPRRVSCERDPGISTYLDVTEVT